MLIDSNEIFFENSSLTAAITGQGVPLTYLKHPGMSEPMPVYITVSEAATGGTSITLNLQTCDTDTAASYVTAESLTIPVADLTAGKRIAWRFMPQTVLKKWVRITVSETGTFTAGKITGIVAREDYLPYRAGLYIDKGKSYPETVVPYVSMACGTKTVTSGTATALGSTACVLETNDPTGLYHMTLAASAGTLSAGTITDNTVNNLNTALAAITINTTVNCTILCTCYDASNNPMSSGTVIITV